VGKTLFLTSHLCSGAFELADILNKNSRIQMFNSNNQYATLEDITNFKDQKHKCLTTAAIHGDLLLYNAAFANKSFYKSCFFIYLIRSGRQTIPEILGSDHFTPDSATRYYCYRLRRMYEMARNTPNAAFLTWDELAAKQGLNLIDLFLNLKEPLEYPSEIINVDLGKNSKEIKIADEAYERYLYKFRQLPLSQLISY